MEAKASHPEDVEAAERSKNPLREQTEVLGQDLRELGRVTREVAREKLEGARKAATDLYGQGRDKAGNLETQVADYVREKPIQSVLVATGLGLLIGAFLSKR